ncbi:hypothetical protein CRE_16519 [Caenorhabditis remanei]|uniref:Uncharacterized protein n=1 Tax=Caenorhabditis remanei TaxID=31234 RepID=E3NNN3_CAERE|nr:hypothetical protein CRE_16519 [Caenorhabditis remanei]
MVSDGDPDFVKEKVSFLNIRKETREMFLILARDDTRKMLKTYAKANASTHESIMKPFIDLIVSTFQTLDAKEKDYEELTKEHDSEMDENIELIRENMQLQDEINFLHELLAEKRKGENMKSVGVMKGVQTEEQFCERVHISNSNVEKVTVVTETKCSNDSESENKLIDHKKERKCLCEGQGIAKIVFENELDYSEDRVSRKADNAKEIFVRKSNKALCCEDIKADEIQSSCTKSTHGKDENIGVTKRCTVANISSDKLCSGDQTPGKAQRSVTFTQYETNEQSVQQKIFSDVIDSNVDLVKDREERYVQDTVREKESMQLLKHMLVVENTKHDYKARSDSSTGGDSNEDEAKRKKVDQKAEDTVTGPGPPLNSKSSFLTSCHTIQQTLSGNNKDNVVRKNNSSDSKIPNPGKPGLKKKGDGACGVVFQMKTKRRKREEPRPRTDPPNLSMTYVKDESIPDEFSVTVVSDQKVIRSPQQHTSDKSTWSETKSKASGSGTTPSERSTSSNLVELE